MSILIRFGLFSTFVLLGACASPSASSSVPEYLAQLKNHPGADLQGRKEREAIASFKAFLGNLTEENIRQNTRTVYAPDAYFNDTLKTEIGAAAIEKYFLGTVRNTESITVTFGDVARSGNDYYLRWVMDVKFKKFARGETVRTIGITHARFNRDGQVILHQDYWDSTQGVFEYVPVIGSGIRLIKSRL